MFTPDRSMLLKKGVIVYFRPPMDSLDAADKEVKLNGGWGSIVSIYSGGGTINFCLYIHLFYPHFKLQYFKRQGLEVV